MKSIIFTYEGYKETNIGDYIQSLAARQFVDEKDVIYWNRDELDKYPENAKVIMNGWFTHRPANWPPSPTLCPLFVAFHINSSAYSELLSEKSIEYLKKYEPIGCRDKTTAELLQERGVKAYFSSCLTTTLGYKYKSAKRSNKIYVVDAVHYVPEASRRIQKYKFLAYYLFHYKGCKKFINSARHNNKYEVNIGKEYNRFCQLVRSYIIVKQLLSKEDLKNTIVLTQLHHEDEIPTSKDRFKRAEELISKYSEAKLVITSRIHVALPCTGLETPVIFLRNMDDSESSFCRFNGLLDLLNVVKFKKNQVISTAFNMPIDTDLIKNPPKYKKFAQQLISICTSFFKS